MPSGFPDKRLPLGWPDEMRITRVGRGPALTARQALDQARTFLLGLEAVSPWRRPFDVSGTTARHGNMPIAEDLSDFDDVVMTALADYDHVKYRNPDAPDDWGLTIDSLSPYGFRMSFSDYVQKKKHEHRVDVTISTPGFATIWRPFGVVPTFSGGVAVHTFGPESVNHEWCKTEVVMKIFEYMINFFAPMQCVVSGADQSLRVRDKNRDRLINASEDELNARAQDQDNDPYSIGWLTYTRNPRFVAALSGDHRVSPYRDGILIKLGDDVSVLTDPAKTAEIVDLRAKLRAAGVTSWLME